MAERICKPLAAMDAITEIDMDVYAPTRYSSSLTDPRRSVGIDQPYCKLLRSSVVCIADTSLPSPRFGLGLAARAEARLPRSNWPAEFEARFEHSNWSASGLGLGLGVYYMLDCRSILSSAIRNLRFRIEQY